MYNDSERLANCTVPTCYYLNDSHSSFYKPQPFEVVIILTVFGLVLITGIIGNILVLLCIVCVKSMRTNVNSCLLSLSIADIIILTLLPISPIVSEFGMDESFMGENFCMFLNFYDRGAVVCSVLLFLYMTVDRYVAVCYPMLQKTYWIWRHTPKVLIAIWITAFLVSVPYLYIGIYEKYTNDNTTSYYCVMDFDMPWKIWYDTALSICTFFLPIPFLSYFYIRMIITIKRTVSTCSTGDSKRHHRTRDPDRKHLMVMLCTLVIIFLLCQIPFTVLTLLDFYYPSAYNFSTYDKKVFVLTWVTRILVYVNSASNPIVYFTMSSKFRRAMKTLFGIKRPTWRSSTYEVSTISLSYSRTS